MVSKKNIKYPNYQNKDYNNPMNKLKEIKGINCRNGDVE